jgi:hypothetical protein
MDQGKRVWAPHIVKGFILGEISDFGYGGPCFALRALAATQGTAPATVETTTPMWPTITHSPPWQFRPASPWPTTSALATVSTIQHRRALFLSSP